MKSEERKIRFLLFTFHFSLFRIVQILLFEVV